MAAQSHCTETPQRTWASYLSTLHFTIFQLSVQPQNTKNVSTRGALCACKYSVILCYITAISCSNGQGSLPPLVKLSGDKWDFTDRKDLPSKIPSIQLHVQKKQQVCHYACAKDFKLWSLIFKDCKDNQSENPLNIALVFGRKPHIWWPNTFAVFWYHIRSPQRSTFAVQRSMTMPPNVGLVATRVCRNNKYCILYTQVN